VGGPGGVPVGLLVVGACSVVVIVVIMVAVIRVGIAALGTPADRAAVNQTLRRTAELLGGRYRDRRDFPWYRRPAQYGALEGDVGGVPYLLYVLPHNTEDHGGNAFLRIRPRDGRPPPGTRPEVRAVSVGVWHWPDQAAPETLAEFVRREVSAAR
jgi:hypothetical protein